ncbi:ABC transporter ATP-binding protein [Tepidimicrobium xylanilyticum]|uniref:Peptide/nickel transport system ATP-binding protein n=1 Tax=Tepidimicrobium xylanilyticum TaxID=1123352 RepID=A0A1H2Q179_9FIRM|nr:ABC transporter ATP-binding protein [Tepidimicrobium xylanilyticum]GMG95790.1 ABC transporter ATP-binding protein [Tepidimicrobium xylanilyticum]SDW00618.1 peptide/nickel transport system ATP-binding protein [Tepidimicrobium xylanilyticum]
MILEVKDFNVTYVNKHKRVYAVKNVNFNIDKGDSLGLVGESGSGKSTLAMALLRLLSKKSTEISGTANFLGRDLVNLSEEELKEIRWKEISVVFQKSMNSLSPVHRIRTQVEDIYRVHNPKAAKEEIRDRFTYLLKLVNLSDRVYNLYPHELSGGMLQRVSIAISLLNNPKLLIMDEATTALDVVTQGQILDEVVKMEKEMDMTRIMITHDMSVVATSCNKVAVMYAGEMMEMGYVKEVLKNPLHPYTEGLIASFPSLKGKKEKLKSIEGFLPDLSKRYEGCIFAPRCSKVMDICKKKPAEVKMDNGTVVRCHLYGGETDEE